MSHPAQTPRRRRYGDHGVLHHSAAVAHCYHSLFLATGAPFACSSMPERQKRDLAEREVAIDIEVEQRRMEALLYSPSGMALLIAEELGLDAL